MKRYLAGLLALLMLLPLAACGGGQEAEKPAMGRYVEKELPLPEGIRQVLALRAEGESTLEMLVYVPNEEEPDRWIDLAILRSEDGGTSWAFQEDDLNEKVEGMGVVQTETAAWDEQGRLYIGGYDETEEEYTTCVLRYDPDGTLTRLPFDLPEDDSGALLRSLKVAGNGDLLVDCWWSLFHLDGETGEILNTFVPEDGSVEGYAIQGNVAVLSLDNQLIYYDMESAAETARIPAAVAVRSTNGNTTWSRLLAFGTDGAAYYADAKGIYRAQQGNSMLEQVVDGDLTKLGTPAFLMQFFAVQEDRFLVVSWAEDRAWHLWSYAYDPDVPTLPGTELRIWSMEDDPLIRQAIGVFQNTHPEVYISYEVYYTGEDAYSWDDALKTLATELVAGKGPDILDLDGLPLEAYEAKGVLLDLSAELKELTDDGTLIPGIAGAYLRDDGTCPAIPTQYSVPLLHGSSSAMAASKDLESMADWLEANRDSFSHPLYMGQIDWLLQFFAAPDLDRIYAGDREAITHYLTQMKRIWDMEMASPLEAGQLGSPVFNFGALSWSVDACGIDMGQLCKFEGLYAAWQTSQDKGDGETDTLFGGGLYQPGTVLGVNAQSQSAELAKAFVKTALSEEVQGAAVGQGLPVNDAAFDASTQEDPEMARAGFFSAYGTTLTDKDGADMPIFLQVKYPPEGYRQEWAQRLKTLDTPVTMDGTLQTMLEEETADFFAGKETLDVAVDRLVKKLELYHAEQG